MDISSFRSKVMLYFIYLDELQLLYTAVTTVTGKLVLSASP